MMGHEDDADVSGSDMMGHENNVDVTVCDSDGPYVVYITGSDIGGLGCCCGFYW